MAMNPWHHRTISDMLFFYAKIHVMNVANTRKNKEDYTENQKETS